MDMKTFLFIALAFTLIALITTAMTANKKDNMKLADKPLVIVRQGQFNVGGTTLQRAGSYDNSKFVGWSEQDETGQRFPRLWQQRRLLAVDTRWA